MNQLLITSKHAIDNEYTQKAHQWLLLHFQKSNKTIQDLVDYLQKFNVTFVFELADDDFQEHVLEYPVEKRGLYLHGVNQNSPVLSTWDSAKLKHVAQEFGFHFVSVWTFDSLNQVKELADSCKETGSLNGQPIEGILCIE
jgi:tRNA ligase